MPVAVTGPNLWNSSYMLTENMSDSVLIRVICLHVQFVVLLHSKTGVCVWYD